MFFYLSFLRPPPQSVSALNGKPNPSSKVVEVRITPQIANDLRITFLEDPIDIFYSWIRASSPSLLAVIASSESKSIINSLAIVEPPVKLTTWHVSSMYKALLVSLPHAAKRGEEWRLALFCQSPSSGRNTKTSLDSIIIDLTKQNVGNLPFPVISMAVRIENEISATSPKKPKGKGSIPAQKYGKEATLQIAKQSQIERFYSIPTPSIAQTSDSVVPSEPDLPIAPIPVVICLREDTSFDLDKKIWDSGLMLSSWFSKLFVSSEKEKDISNPLKDCLWKRIYSNSTQFRVLELGCGTGIVSICLSALLNGFIPSHWGRTTEVFASDQASAISIIDHNISVNKRAFPSIDIKSLILDWDCDTFPPETATPFDLVIMADVTYNTASFPSLVRTICSLVKPSSLVDMASDGNSSHWPYILLAYKQRDEAERSLWDMLKEKGVALVLVDKITAQCGVKSNDSLANSKSELNEKVEIWAWFPCSGMI